jgi:hypothetical protein
MIRFTMVGIPAAAEVGVAAGIVYGQFEATLPAVSTDAPLYGCSRVPRYNAETGRAGRWLVPQLPCFAEIFRQPPREQA